MPGDLTLALRIRTQLGDAVRNLERLEKELGDTGRAGEKADRGARSAARGVDAAGRSAERARRQLGTLGVAFGTLAGQLGAGAVSRALAAPGRLIGGAVRATIRQEQALAQVAARLRSTGRESETTVGRIAEIAAALQRVTAAGDEAILEAQSVLLTFTNIDTSVIEAATETVLDLAVAMGQDAPAAARQLGLALEDPARGLTQLRRAGTTFTEAQKEQILALYETGRAAEGQAEILRIVRGQVGGAARAMRNTLGGALQALSNAWGDLLEAEEGTDELAASVERLTDAISDPETVRAAQTLFGAMLEAAAYIVENRAAILQVAAALGGAFAGARLGRAVGGRRGAAIGGIAGGVAGLIGAGRGAGDAEAAPPAPAPRRPVGRLPDVGRTPAPVPAKDAEKAAREAERAARDLQSALEELEDAELDIAGDGFRRALVETQRWRNETVAALEAAGVAAADYQARVADVVDARLSAALDEHERGILEASRAWRDGAALALEEYADAATNAAHNAGEAVTSTLDGMGDALADMVARGKLDFSSLADSIIADLARIAVQQAIVGPIAGALGGLFGGGGGTAAAAIFHAGGVVGAAGGARRAVPPALFAGAPRLHAGGVAGLRGDEIPAILQRGETVLPRGAATLPPVVVNFTNEGTPQRQARPARADFDGRRWLIDIAVEDVDSGGPLAAAIERATGARAAAQ